MTTKERKNIMQLKERTTYLDGRGNRVNIAGHARREKVNGQNVWWSIQGDHYTDDGQFVCLRRVKGTAEREMQYESFTTDSNVRNLVQECDSPSDRAWWVGVVTDT
jgi:hypothetical protein